jgi:Glycosyltransferase family 87
MSTGSTVDSGPSTGMGTLLLLLLVLPLYLLTMVDAGDVNVDTDPGALPAWQLVQHGTMDLSGLRLDDNPFIFPTDSGRVMSDRPPGLSLFVVPAYALTNDPTYSPNPSTLSSALIAMAAVLVLHLVLRRCVPPWWAFGGALAFAVCLATWPISSTQLWPHGPGQLLFALALLALASRRPALAGLAMGVEVLVRPIGAVVPAVLSGYALWQRRWRDAVVLAVPAVVGLIAIVLYNSWAFGEPSISGGYGAHFRDSLTDQSLLGYFRNLSNMIVSPTNGLLLWSPILIPALLGLRRSWSATPEWARQAAVAGLVYLVIHPRLNRASGGLPYDYRYPLETLTLAAPALVLGARAFLQGVELRRRILVVTAAAALLLQGTVAFTYHCDEVIEDQLATCSLF